MIFFPYKHFLVVLTAVLIIISGSFSAFAIDIQAEQTFLKVLKAFYKEADPNTIDVDKNGIPDRAHVRLLDKVLSDPNVPNHDLIQAIYYFNWVQIKKDNNLGNYCILLYQIYNLSCEELEKFAAGVVTLGEPSIIKYFVSDYATQYGLVIDLRNYNLTGGLFLRGVADLDGDGISNRKEYQLADGDFDVFVEKAITPESIPREGSQDLPPPLDPNLPVVITPAVNSKVDFGTVPPNSSKETEFRVKNVGSDPIPFEVWILGEPEFTIQGERTYITNPQGEAIFKVQFLPRVENTYTGVLVFEIYGKRYYCYLGGKCANTSGCGCNNGCDKEDKYFSIIDYLWAFVVLLALYNWHGKLYNKH